MFSVAFCNEIACFVYLHFMNKRTCQMIQKMVIDYQTINISSILELKSKAFIFYLLCKIG